jgi:hypothetical protein
MVWVWHDRLGVVIPPGGDQHLRCKKIIRQQAFESASRSMGSKQRMIRSLLRSVSLEQKAVLTMRKERLDAGYTGLSLVPTCDAPMKSRPQKYGAILSRRS